MFQGHKLRQLRESKKMTMQEINEMTGIKAGSLSEIETGKNKNPRPATVDKLCAVLGVDPIYFYYDGDNLMDLFPSEIPSSVRQFVFDVNNLSFIELAMKIQQTSLTAEEAENIIMLYAKSVNEAAAKR
jgi:transcriptional regulator with XRE-family HTH domain